MSLLEPIRRYATPYLLMSDLTSYFASVKLAFALTLPGNTSAPTHVSERVRPLAPRDGSLLIYGPTELLSFEQFGLRRGGCAQLVNLEEAPRRLPAPVHGPAHGRNLTWLEKLPYSRATLHNGAVAPYMKSRIFLPDHRHLDTALGITESDDHGTKFVSEQIERF